MHRIRIWIRGFFGFSRKETNAFLILLPLMIVILISEPVYRTWKFRNNDVAFFDHRYTDSVLANLTYSTRDSMKVVPREKKDIHFTSFDPNTISEKELEGLGLSPFMAGRIAKYRKKGGRFKKKEDLLRIYGMDSLWFMKASMWITLPEESIQKKAWKQFETKTARTPELIDINSADSVQLVNIFGVGPALSKRILNYRNKLGGFISMDQLGEVYGLDTIALKEIKRRFVLSPQFIPHQIDLNSASPDELIVHPYIKRREAQAIVNYRNQHGDFGAIDDVLKVQVINSAWLQKARPYLRTTPAGDENEP